MLWIEQNDENYDFVTIGKARPSGGGINTVWTGKKDGKYDYVTVGSFDTMAVTISTSTRRRTSL